MSLQALFKSRMAQVRYIFKDGSTAVFANGRYFTDVEEKIDELVNEVKHNHPHIFIDDAEQSIDPDADPLAAVKEEAARAAVEAYIAAQNKVALDKKANTSEYEASTKLEGMANSDTVNAAASESSSGATANAASAASTVQVILPASMTSGAKIVAGPVGK